MPPKGSQMNMRRLILAPIFVGVLLVTVSCSNPFQPTTTPEEQAATVAPEVKTAVEEFLAKINAHDADGAGEFLADDASFQWIEDGRTVYETRAAAIAGLGSFFSGFNASRLEAYDVKIAMLAEEAAIASFRFSHTISAGGQAALKSEGIMTLALSQRDGSWKIVVANKSASGFPR
jgi:ketosteroid isomerase-like protein